MSNSILIGATKHMDLLQERLHNEFQPLERMGCHFKVDLEQDPDGNFTFLNCNFYSSSENYGGNYLKSIYRGNVANAICEIIITYWEKYLLENIITESYYYFEPGERDTILSYALQYISNKGVVYRQKRKNKILNELNEFLDSNDYIVIDGFIRFRLKDYLDELCEVAEQAVDDFLMEREYEEFIQLLKYFVDIQEPSVEIVNVLLNAEEVFQLYDENWDSINNDSLEGLVVEFITSEINYEDLLISSLISLAPKEIVFHFPIEKKYKTITQTINKVFPDRVKKCSGCSLCEESKR